MKKLSAKEVVAKAKAKRTGTARPGNGGARAGAGRKPKAEKYKSAIAQAEGQIRDRLPELIDLLFDIALKPNIHGAKTSIDAAKYLINRVMGMPAQPVEREFSELTDEELIAAIESEIS